DTVATVTITAQPNALSNDSTPSVTFTTTGATTITCRLDSAAPVACTSPFTFGVTADGSHTITVAVSDGAGNSDSATTTAFVIDTVATVTITAPPAALSNDTTPNISFTATGATTITCRVDAGTPVACTSPFAFGVTADGTHTITVAVSDGAGNSDSETTGAFVIDSIAPVVTFTDTPPAAWPVNYFDMKFAGTDVHAIVAFECSLNGAGFTTCGATSPVTLPITTTYNTASTFRVRARDAANNTSTPIQTAWTSADGLVLHYPFEQGSTNNTSLLAQNQAYSPDGSVPTLAFLGGWGGTALGRTIARHGYPTTDRVLSSSPGGTYTASFWIRPRSDVGNGIIFSTLDADGGVEVKIQGNALTTTVREANGQLFTAQVSIPVDQWTSIGLRTTGFAKKLDIFVNGNQFTSVDAPNANGFGTLQAKDLVVGASTNLDLDDLRFYNKAFTNAEMCSVVARGTANSQQFCIPLSPGVEVDFEGDQILDTGFWNLFLSTPTGSSQFVQYLTGKGLRYLTSDQLFGYVQGGIINELRGAHGHSISLWFDANGGFGRLVDFMSQNGGMFLRYADNGLALLSILTDRGFSAIDVAIPVLEGKKNSIVITEERSGTRTVAINVFVNGALARQIAVSAGDVFATPSDVLVFMLNQNQSCDELEFWTEDLAKNPESLCENGFDGLFDHSTNTCLLTANN
ncbi:MAG: LamG-like jellyroll fold domain-containing protein, partial [Kofleriaceae bacterium]